MKKKVSKFKKQVAADSHRQKTAASSYGYLKLPKGINVFKDEEGRMQLDILPYIVTDERHPDRNPELEIAIPGELWYKRPFKVHRNVGVDKDTVVCLTSFGKKCPICEYKAKRVKEGAEKEELDSMKASQRNIYAVIPIGSKKMDEKVHVWDISQYLFQNLLNEELEEDPDFAVFPDLEEGYTLKIRFEEQTIGKNKFNEVKRIDFVEREEAYGDDILEDVPNLDEMLTELSYEELYAKFFEVDIEEVPAGENDSKPVRRRAAKPVEDDDEEEEKPRRRKTKSAPEPEDDPEDEDDDPPPVTRRKKGKPGDWEEPEDEEETPPAKPYTRSGGKGLPKPTEDEDDGYPPGTPDWKKIPDHMKREEFRKKKPTKVEDEPPVKKGRSAEKAAEKDRCPHGHKFAHDCEKFDECDTCKIWDECIEAQEAL